MLILEAIFEGSNAGRLKKSVTTSTLFDKNIMPLQCRKKYGKKMAAMPTVKIIFFMSIIILRTAYKCSAIS